MGLIQNPYSHRSNSPDSRANRLLAEKSPYLLQHAYNPVDWFPWGDEAFARARSEDKPIFLSIGYSTCYWCHVMEREVFENPQIAELMNRTMISIKVDREERPDIDRIYMTAVQAMTGSGGWPMSVFMTPDRKPFFGGTYIPPVAAHGRAGFTDIVTKIDELWKGDRLTLIDAGNRMTDHLTQAVAAPGTEPGEDVLRMGFERLSRSFDVRHGGFGHAPKFPRPSSLMFLFQVYFCTGNRQALTMAVETLRGMARGGIRDHLGGGFHRYSVDHEWRVPHFEKMLYDQAQLVLAYLSGYHATREESFAAVARETLDFVLREFRDSRGGFFSALDAESALDSADPNRKREGAYYTWTQGEIRETLGTGAAEITERFFGVGAEGNTLHDPMNILAGQNILYLAKDESGPAAGSGRSPDEIKRILSESRGKLLARRNLRPRPSLDDKIITAWNGLAISAFACAAQTFGHLPYLRSAKEAATFISDRMIDHQQQTLFRRYRDGEARFEGGLQDYAFFVAGLIDLYEASSEERWLQLALHLTRKQIALFTNPDGGFFDCTPNDPTLLFRTREDYDGAEPAGNSMAALNLVRLAAITRIAEFRVIAADTFRAFAPILGQHPDSLVQMLLSIGWSRWGSRQIVISGPKGNAGTGALIRAAHDAFRQNSVLLFADPETSLHIPELEHLREYESPGKPPRAYVCRDYACLEPTGDPRRLSELLSAQAVHNEP